MKNKWQEKIKTTNAYIIAAVVLVVGLMVSALAYQWQRNSNHQQAEFRMGLLANRVSNLVNNQMRLYEYGLRGSRGAVLVAGTKDIGNNLFKEYIASRDLETEFPGARGMGFIVRVPREQEQQYVESLSKDLEREFKIRELNSHTKSRYVIQYVEPYENNKEAVGLDIGSEENRRAAADAAMLSGKATLTAPITLVQESGKPQRSFLLLLPVYQQGVTPDSIEQREQTLFGWSYAPLVIDEILSKLELLNKDYNLVMSDITDDDNQLFYNSSEAENTVGSDYKVRIQSSLYGRIWQAEITATPAFIAALGQTKPGRFAASFVFLSFLFSLLSFVYMQNRQRAEYLHREQARRASLVANSSDAIISVTLDGEVTDWNHSAERMFGFSEYFALGRNFAAFMVPEERQAEDEDILQKITNGEEQQLFETFRLCSDGSLREVSISASPVNDESGKLVGISKTIRDITESKRIARQVHELNIELEEQVKERTSLLKSATRDLKNILNALPSVIGYWDKDYRNKFANHAFLSWYGMAPEDMPGTLLNDFMGDSFEGSRGEIEAALRGHHQEFERTIPIPGTDRKRHILVQYIPDIGNDDVRGFYAIAYDISTQVLQKGYLAAALRENEALLSTIHEFALVSETDSAGQITEINDNFCQLSGYSREELLGNNHRVINSDRHSPEFWKDMWETISSGKSWRGDICNKDKNGDYYWVNSIIAPRFNDFGEIEKYISIRTNITASKEYERNLEESRAFLDRTGRVAGIGGWQYDVGSQRMTWSTQMYSLYEVDDSYSPDLATDMEYFDEENLPLIQAAVEQAVSSGQGWDMELPMTTAQGKTIWVRSVAEVQGFKGRAIQIVGSVQDISIRKFAELRLTKTSSLLERVLEAASEVSIIAVDEQMNISVFNSGAERLLGYSADEVIGCETPLMIHDQQEVAKRSAEINKNYTGMDVLVAPERLGIPGEWTYLHKDGSRIDVSLVVTEICDDLGKNFGYVGVAHDVSRQKAYEVSLRHAIKEAQQANEAKSRFLANMSHEIRSPMNAVIGISYLLSKTQLDLTQTDYLKKITGASKSLLSIINDILDLSKIEAGVIELEKIDFSLQDMMSELSDLMQALASSKSLNLVVEAEAEMSSWFNGDVFRLKQILTNLLSNSIKFTHQGEVKLSIKKLQSHNSEMTLKFSVSDTGIGIDNAAKEHLFDPFSQADSSTTRCYGGSGLGLAIVKNLVELMGGDYGVSSTPGVGSEFWVTLKLAVARSPALIMQQQANSSDAQNQSLQGSYILLVDDSEINREIAAHILEMEGAQVVNACNGEEAVEYLKAQQVDLVLMDLQMPVLDGYQATRIIRDELGLHALPILALTAGAMNANAGGADAKDFDGWINKPFDPTKLVGLIGKYLRTSKVAKKISKVEPDPEIVSELVLPGTNSAEGIIKLRGNKALYCELFKKFLDEYQACSLFTGVAAQDAASIQDLKFILHKMLGTSGLLGAHELQKRIGEAQEAMQRQDLKRLQSHLDIISMQIKTLAKALAQQVALDAPLSGLDKAPNQESSPVPLDTCNLEELVSLLKQQNIKALALYQSMNSQLEGALDTETYAQLCIQMDSLLFLKAADTLGQLYH